MKHPDVKTLDFLNKNKLHNYNANFYTLFIMLNDYCFSNI